ncbi:MAG: Cytochrome c biogenesis protein transmembrane region [Candidatus Nomurabacteria bacterium GW2011_GWB1_40_7]|uniref:Cytochrome c biogenesis protein transmembrane region n=1 Tax=Candidatus Nomurabacteria bacterium GW2011_GWB1_40_7 TaxID=1618744 RepID=A0A0G0T022_9BACT|nr:MAG: Cytochrome c biogenesis protein transmembrane region [Candidatus Nomurabacteria bacterium GW2011_GWB1_40_7]
METLVGTSLIAAFVAGVAALFAPCCITVLLPSYLGNIFREKYKIFFMTFIFFLGILTVFLPIGLGASFLAQLFSKYHNIIFIVGGIFLVALGITMLLGKKFALPFSVRGGGMKRNVASIYVLGIFSAIATTCCAPVLAGVLILSATSGTVVWGALYTLAYVIGMTLPLFIIAIFLDKVNLTERLTNANKTIAMRIGGFSWNIVVSELISGLIFLLMGGYITYLAFSNKLFAHSDYQLQMNLWNAKFLSSINGFVTLTPEYIWALLFIGIVVVISYAFIKQYKKQKNEQ